MSTSSRLRLTSSRWLLVVSTLLAGLAVSTAAWWAVGNIAERAIDARFARATAGVATRVEGRLDATESTVQAVRGLLDASEETTAAELSRFLGALSDGRSPTERFPGLTALALVNADGTIDLAAPGDSQTLALVADALVRPRAAAALEQATDQARPITVSLPTGEDRLALAVARYSDPAAADPSATTQHRRQAVVGWVVALVDVDHLLADVVLVVGQDEISVTLRDDSGRVLATSGQLAPGEPGLARDLTLDRDGDSLLLEVRVDSSLPGQAAHVPQLVLLLGTLLALAGAGLVWLLVTQRERALAQVAEATTALADSNAELEETNERLREFAGVVAHDLRGPLTAVHGMLSALELRISDDLEPLDAELLARATRNSIQMDELIVDVLRYAESGVTPTDLEVLDLATTLTEVLERLEPLRQPDDVIDISVTGAVMADATGLRRVLGNLISNTLKYRHDGHPARVEVRTRREQDRVIIEVADDGPGIPHELRTELLAPFRRGDTSKDGSGLGLAICTRIVTNHGGTLEVDDADLGGALVRFDLPSA